MLAGLRQSRVAAISQVFYLRDVTHETEVDQMKTEFLSTAAHELRTPMASIFGFVELLRVRVMSEARRKELLDIVHRQARQMVGILDDLLDLSRLESRGKLGWRLSRTTHSSPRQHARPAFTTARVARRRCSAERASTRRRMAPPLWPTRA